MSRRSQLLFVLVALSLRLPTLSFAQEGMESGPTSTDPLRLVNEAVDIKFSVEAGAQAASGTGTFWGLAETYAGQADYSTQHTWIEGYMKPSLSARLRLSDRSSVFGGVGVTASGTLGTDYFEAGDTGRVRLGLGYLGFRWSRPEDDLRLELSGGQQEYRLGHGLLLATGGGNGFERGALTTFPYRAWAMTGVARVVWKSLALEGFYLDPDELSSSDTRTTLAGVSATWTPAPRQFVGLSFFEVLESAAPYPQAPVAIVENGREGLQVLAGSWNVERNEGPLAGLSFLGEVAVQRNHRIEMEAWGGGVEVGYRFLTAKHLPRVSYSARYFSGDDPGTTATLERFDGLFWDGSPATWASGSNGALAFYNSNLMVHRARLELVVSPRDLVSFTYFLINAAETDSPLQFGQATRLVTSGDEIELISGVPDKHLTQDVYLEYVRIVGPNLFVTTGLAYSRPGAGIRAITVDPRTWIAGLLNVTVKY